MQKLDFDKWWDVAGKLGFEHRLASATGIAPPLRDILDLNLDDPSILDLPGGALKSSCKDRIIEVQGYEDFARDDILMTRNGTSQAIFLVIKALVGAGEEILVDVPSWPQYAAYSLEKKKFIPLPYGQCEGTCKLLHRKMEDGWKYPVEELKKQVSSKTKLILLQTPGHNPTGAASDIDEIKTVCEIAEDYGAYLLHDEICRGTELDAPYSTPAAVNLYDKAICVASLSKGLGLEGLRLGWIAMRDKELMEKCAALAYWHRNLEQHFALIVANAALESKKFKELLNKNRKIMKENWWIVSQWISNSDIFSWVPPKAAFLSFPRYALDMDSWTFCERVLKEYKTLLVPGICYGFEKHVRLGIGKTTPANVIHGLKQLDKFIETLK